MAKFIQASTTVASLEGGDYAITVVAVDDAGAVWFSDCVRDWSEWSPLLPHPDSDAATSPEPYKCAADRLRDAHDGRIEGEGWSIERGRDSDGGDCVIIEAAGGRVHLNTGLFDEACRGISLRWDVHRFGWAGHSMLMCKDFANGSNLIVTPCSKRKSTLGPLPEDVYTEIVQAMMSLTSEAGA